MMRPNRPLRPDAEAAGALIWAIPLAVAVWIVIFAWRPSNFWLLMAAGTGGLGGLALRLRGAFPTEEGVRAQDLGTGAAAAAALYGVFALGRAIAGRLLPSAPGQISDVYTLRSQAPWPVIALLLILVIGPGEELFWRGFVQWRLVRRLGPGLGWGAATAIYGGVHAAAANPMLVLAALVAGGFWGLLYLRIGRIAPLIVSHVLWDLAVFLLLPFR
ncbi:MAG TPA: CPBP family intramembrane glutamic endopeptidase [bacterium]|nr:CPBP family intramembrane glutamic endopeptidase [bacterium]